MGWRDAARPRNEHQTHDFKGLRPPRAQGLRDGPKRPPMGCKKTIQAQWVVDHDPDKYQIL